jgi:hypothetical protein
MLMIILVVGTMLIKTLIDFHEEEKIRNNETKGIINKGEDTGKDITDQSTETIIHGPMYIKIYNHLENLYYDDVKNVIKHDQNLISYYFIDEETDKRVMFTVNRKNRLFYFMVEAKSDGVNSRIADKMAYDDYTPYGKDIQLGFLGIISFCLDESLKGNYLNHHKVSIFDYSIHITFVEQENYYAVFFIDDIEQ